MKRSRFSEEQIACAPRLAESGTPVVDVCRQIGVSEATYKKSGDLGVSELKRLKILEGENARKKASVELRLQTCWRRGCPQYSGIEKSQVVSKLTVPQREEESHCTRVVFRRIIESHF